MFEKLCVYFPCKSLICYNISFFQECLCSGFLMPGHGILTWSLLKSQAVCKWALLFFAHTVTWHATTSILFKQRASVTAFTHPLIHSSTQRLNCIQWWEALAVVPHFHTQWHQPLYSQHTVSKVIDATQSTMQPLTFSSNFEIAQIPCS